MLNSNADEVEAAAAAAGRKPQLQDFGMLLGSDGKQHINVEFMIRPRIAMLVKLQGAANGVDLRPPALRQRCRTWHRSSNGVWHLGMVSCTTLCKSIA